MLVTSVGLCTLPARSHAMVPILWKPRTSCEQHGSTNGLTAHGDFDSMDFFCLTSPCSAGPLPGAIWCHDVHNQLQIMSTIADDCRCRSWRNSAANSSPPLPRVMNSERVTRQLLRSASKQLDEFTAEGAGGCHGYVVGCTAKSLNYRYGYL